jgi:DHA1 family inner membrane transport protein
MSIAAGFGWASTGPVGAVLALGGLMLFGISALLDRRQRRWQPLPVLPEVACGT